MWILAKILALATFHDRYFPEIKWSRDSWTHNIFRFYEMLFGRRVGIRAESSSCSYSDSEGNSKSIVYCHSWESVLAFLETQIRNFFGKRISKGVRIYIPVLQTPMGIPIVASPYLFAIAFDAAGGETAQSVGTTVTISQTVTGSNVIIFAGIVDQAGGTTNVTGVTWNTSENYTLITQSTNAPGNDGTSYLWYLVNPTTGSHNSVATRTSATNAVIGGSSSYSGAAQTSPIDTSSQGGTTSASITGTVTTGTANCWTVQVGYCRGEFPGSAGAGSTQRTSNNLGQLLIVDSNGTVTSGSPTTLTITATGTGNHSYAIAAFKPSVASGPTNVKTWDGITQSTGIKTYMGVALASVKSVEGVT